MGTARSTRTTGKALALALMLAPCPTLACDTALVLAMDVSGSVDAYEFQLQAMGVAQAILDPAVTDALIHGRVALSVLQWSGAMEQIVSIPWTRITEPAEARTLARRVSQMPRTYAGGNTAVGEAIEAAADLFSQVDDCRRWVIDVSGDGDENESYSLPEQRRAAYRRGIIINGLAIEGAATGQSITNFYRRNVMTPDGFVITAAQHSDFARAMREKMLRELVPPVARLPIPAPRLPDLAPSPQFLALDVFLHPQTR